LFDARQVALDFTHSGLVVLLHRDLEQLASVPQAGVHPVEYIDDLLEPRALATEFLRLFGRAPDRRVFQLAGDLRETLALQVVLKETP